MNVIDFQYMLKPLKFLLLLIIVLLLNTEAWGQKSQLKVKDNEITVPINISFSTTIKMKKGNIKKIKLLEQDKVNRPLDVMEVLSDIDSERLNPEEVRFQFSNADYMGTKVIVLTTLHRLEYPLTFKAKIKYKGSEEYKETSITPKYPGSFSIEQWQDQVESIVIYDFKLLKE